ncbi:hypothetical protein F5I97DRAFT_1871020, partial [Phlebopus sp. FC_14]
MMVPTTAGRLFTGGLHLTSSSWLCIDASDRSYTWQPTSSSHLYPCRGKTITRICLLLPSSVTNYHCLPWGLETSRHSMVEATVDPVVKSQFTTARGLLTLRLNFVSCSPFSPFPGYCPLCIVYLTIAGRSMVPLAVQSKSNMPLSYASMASHGLSHPQELSLAAMARSKSALCVRWTDNRVFATDGTGMRITTILWTLQFSD